MVIAVDFDGTLCSDQFPNEGNPNYFLIDWLKEQQRLGHKLILWTCREGWAKDRAIKWCELVGLKFDAVNENLIEWEGKIQMGQRKIVADIYIDDKAIRPSDICFDADEFVKDDFNESDSMVEKQTTAKGCKEGPCCPAKSRLSDDKARD